MMNADPGRGPMRENKKGPPWIHGGPPVFTVVR